MDRSYTSSKLSKNETNKSVLYFLYAVSDRVIQVLANFWVKVCGFCSENVLVCAVPDAHQVWIVQNDWRDFYNDVWANDYVKQLQKRQC